MKTEKEKESSFDDLSLVEELPSVKESEVVKESRTELSKLSGQPLSKLSSKLTLNGRSFSYGPHKRADKIKSHMGTVRKLFTADSKQPTHAVKKYNHDMHQIEAVNETQCSRLLGRDAHYFIHKKSGKARVILEWVEGKMLSEFFQPLSRAEDIKRQSYPWMTAAELSELDERYVFSLSKDRLDNLLALVNTPFETRWRCLASLFYELYILHSHNIVHSDLHGDNCILNLEKGTIKLIDFGRSFKLGGSKSVGWVDMISMSTLAKTLFPEVYPSKVIEENPTFFSDFSDVIASKTLTEPQQLAIRTLIDSINRPGADVASSLEALNYCNGIIRGIQDPTPPPEQPLQEPSVAAHGGSKPQELKKAVELKFPISADFSGSVAKFEYQSWGDAILVRETLEPPPRVSMTEKGRCYVEFTSEDCRNGRVKEFLQLFTYPSGETLQAADFLAFRVQRTDSYGEGYGSFFGESRDTCCTKAFEKIVLQKENIIVKASTLEGMTQHY